VRLFTASSTGSGVGGRTRLDALIPTSVENASGGTRCRSRDDMSSFPASQIIAQGEKNEVNVPDLAAFLT